MILMFVIDNQIFVCLKKYFFFSADFLLFRKIIIFGKKLK